MSRLTPRRRGRVRRGEQGLAIPMAMAVVTIVVLLSVVLSDVAVGQIGQVTTDRYRAQALATAQAGLDVALDQLRTDPTYPGVAATALAAGAGTYTITVAPGVDAAHRVVSVLGVYPTAAATRRASRTVHAEVALTSVVASTTSAATFPDAWLCGGGSCSSDGGLALSGAVYSDGSVSLGGPQADSVDGGVTVANGDVTLGSGASVQGGVATDGEARLAAGSTVTGPVGAASDVINAGAINGSTTSGGSVSGAGTFGGPVQQNVAPAPRPTVRSRPDFAWDSDRFAGATVWASSAAFAQWVAGRVNTGQPLTGVHRIDDPTPFTLSGPASVAGDVTIVARGPVRLDGASWSSAGGAATVAVIATGSGPGDQITCASSVSTGPGVTLLWWSDGPVRFSCGGSFTGAVAAPSIVHAGGAQLVVTHAAPTDPGGFTLPAGGTERTSTVSVVRFWLG